MVPVRRVGQGHCLRDRFPGQHVAQHAVVRPDKPPAIGLYGDGPSPGSHARVDDDHVDRVRRPEGISGQQYERAPTDVLWPDVVRNVHQLVVRGDAMHDALHGPHVTVLEAKVGDQGHNRRGF